MKLKRRVSVLGSYSANLRAHVEDAWRVRLSLPPVVRLIDRGRSLQRVLSIAKSLLHPERSAPVHDPHPRPALTILHTPI